MKTTFGEFNQFDLVPDYKGELIATHKDLAGKEFQSVSTGGDYGCAGCHFKDRIHEANKTGSCHTLPCGTTDWPDKRSRIWIKA
jgi:hypothetical protein